MVDESVDDILSMKWPWLRFREIWPAGMTTRKKDLPFLWKMTGHLKQRSSEQDRETGSRRTPKLVRFLLGDPLVRAGFQHVEWERAAVQDFVMEGADIELGA